jgi:ATP-binding cassette, subfamily B, bacterial
MSTSTPQAPIDQSFHQAATGRPSPGTVAAGRTSEEAAKREKSRDMKPLTRLLPYLWRRPVELGLAGLFLILAAGATLALPAAARVLVDRGFASATPEEINRWFVVLMAVVMALAVFSATRFYFVTRLGERVVADFRADVYDRLIGLSPAYFSQIRTGEAISRLTVDATLIETLVSSSASIAIRNILMLIGGLAMMLTTSPALTGMVALIIPAIIVPLVIFGRMVRKLSSKTQDLVAVSAAEASESLDAVETVQAFGGEDRARLRFRSAVEASFQASVQRIMARSLMTALAFSIVFGGIAFVLWTGAQSVLNGTMTAGALTQFVFLALLTGSGTGALAEVWGDVQKAAGATQRMSEILDETPKIAAPENPVTFAADTQALVRFESVAFTYGGNQSGATLKGVSFDVLPGQTVAIVGPSGAGKSTLFKLLLRFYDPDSGTITLDGIDARSTDPKEWRRRFAYVSQNPDLFTGSALDNILFGNPGASVQDAHMAAEHAEAAPFILSRLGGYDKPIGDRGRALSGGERQRLAIARALVRDAPILLLDEATSALDAENERLVQKAFDVAMTNRTTLVIAHRLATVQRADKIVVMEAGTIVEVGTHASLLAKGGLYAHLASLQFNQADAAA